MVTRARGDAGPLPHPPLLSSRHSCPRLASALTFPTTLTTHHHLFRAPSVWALPSLCCSSPCVCVAGSWRAGCSSRQGRERSTCQRVGSANDAPFCWSAGRWYLHRAQLCCDFVGVCSEGSRSCRRASAKEACAERYGSSRSALGCDGLLLLYHHPSPSSSF